VRYTVVWIPSAERDLADLWLTATDRAAVTRAANDIDRLVQHDPDQQGESRPDGVRILFVAPLGVRFEVLPDDRLVRVLHVWQY